MLFYCWYQTRPSSVINNKILIYVNSSRELGSIHCANAFFHLYHNFKDSSSCSSCFQDYEQFEHLYSLAAKTTMKKRVDNNFSPHNRKIKKSASTLENLWSGQFSSHLFFCSVASFLSILYIYCPFLEKKFVVVSILHLGQVFK